MPCSVAYGTTRCKGFSHAPRDRHSALAGSATAGLRGVSRGRCVQRMMAPMAAICCALAPAGRPRGYAYKALALACLAPCQTATLQQPACAGVQPHGRSGAAGAPRKPPWFAAAGGGAVVPLQHSISPVPRCRAPGRQVAACGRRCRHPDKGGAYGKPRWLFSV